MGDLHIRKGFSKALYNRRLLKRDIPKTWDLMRDEGLWYKPTRTGYQFYCGRYLVTNLSISNGWNISPAAVKRIAEWLATQHESKHVSGDWDWE